MHRWRWKACGPRPPPPCVCRLLPGERGGLHFAPFGAQRFDHGRQHEALDIGARGVVGAELVALAGIEGALQQGAEDGRLDVAPVGAGGFDEQADLVAVEGDGGAFGEQAAVEAQHFAAQDGREATGIHGLPQVLDHRREAARVVGEALQQLGEGPRRQQADVLGKHGEQCPHQEAGDMLRCLAGGFERLGEPRQPVGDFAVTRAERRAGSRLSGSSHTARRRSRISSRRRSARRMRWLRGSGRACRWRPSG